MQGMIKTMASIELLQEGANPGPPPPSQMYDVIKLVPLVSSPTALDDAIMNGSVATPDEGWGFVAGPSTASLFFISNWKLEATIDS